MTIIPKPTKVVYKNKKFLFDTVKLTKATPDDRVNNAVKKLPISDNGAELTIKINGEKGEGYVLDLEENTVLLEADSPAGAFYGIQTLRQIFESKNIECVHIEDAPDFEYRGLYHDITDGQIPKVSTLKKLIDDLAYFKSNSLQLYIEHSFEFKECAGIMEKKGYITTEELKELDEYCYQNFIELVPSTATFGHMYEILNQEKYSHLREVDEDNQHFWLNKMFHHTLNPTLEESLALAKSLIDQQIACFRSDKFNICCDETFDLVRAEHDGADVGRLYVDFVKKLVDYLKSKGKTVMMWADILLEYPEVATELPEDTIFLNWDYALNPNEERIKFFDDINRTQVVCPGVWAWSRFNENVYKATENISKLADYGKKYNAMGMLNTNWGDTGNPASLNMAMYGIVLGAAKAWNVKTVPDEEYDRKLCILVYKNPNAVKYIKELSDIWNSVDGGAVPHSCTDNHNDRMWNMLVEECSNIICGSNFKTSSPPLEVMEEAHQRLQKLLKQLKAEDWQREDFGKDIILATEGNMLVLELYTKAIGTPIKRSINTNDWLTSYGEAWLDKNKPSELAEIEKLLVFMEDLK